jgi:hypothetical protein
MGGKVPDIIYAILGNIFAWTIVSSATTGFERYFLYVVIVAVDAAYVIGKFKGH